MLDFCLSRRAESIAKHDGAYPWWCTPSGCLAISDEGQQLVTPNHDSGRCSLRSLACISLAGACHDSAVDYKHSFHRSPLTWLLYAKNGVTRVTCDCVLPMLSNYTPPRTTRYVSRVISQQFCKRCWRRVLWCTESRRFNSPRRPGTLVHVRFAHLSCSPHLICSRPYSFLLPILLQSCMLLLMHELFVCPFMSHADLLAAALCCMGEALGMSQRQELSQFEVYMYTTCRLCAANGYGPCCMSPYHPSALHHTEVVYRPGVLLARRAAGAMDVIGPLWAWATLSPLSSMANALECLVDEVQRKQT